ncbi:DUF4340 domain-containing protein [bacterium]|nr:DUF4340 domain-containing protein [bacterium]
MKRKPLLLLGVVILIAIIIFIIESPFKSQRGVFKEDPLFKNLNLTKAHRIEIQYLINGVQLKQDGGDWFVSDLKTKLGENLDKQNNADDKQEEEKWYDADYIKIESALRILMNLKTTSLVSKNKEKHNLFQVGENIAQNVKVFDASDNLLADLYIGKRGPSFMNTYVRRGESDEVYLVDKYLQGVFEADLSSWRDKVIWDISINEIVEVYVKNQGSEYLLIQDDVGKWVLDGSPEIELDQDKIHDFAVEISNIKAVNFNDSIQPSDINIERAVLTLKVNTAPDDLYLFTIVKKDKKYFGLKNGGKTIYEMTNDFVDSIPKSWEAFKASENKESMGEAE